MRLSRPFLAQLPAERRPRPWPHLDDTLEELLDACRQAWPALSVPEPVFLAYLARRLPTRANLEEWLGEVHAKDLYLACACLEGSSGALSLLESRYLEPICAQLAARERRPDLAGELSQALRTRLLVASSGNEPRLAAYTRKGPLEAWLRVAAVRLATDIRRMEARPDAQARALPTPAQRDPELAFLKARYGAQLAEAFQATIAGLPTRERNILRLHYFDGLSTYAIGAMYDVHATTVVRWLARARALILERARGHLQEHLNVATAELDSLLELAHSELDITLGRFLKTVG